MAVEVPFHPPPPPPPPRPLPPRPTGPPCPPRRVRRAAPHGAFSGLPTSPLLPPASAPRSSPAPRGALRAPRRARRGAPSWPPPRPRSFVIQRGRALRHRTAPPAQRRRGALRVPVARWVARPPSEPARGRRLMPRTCTLSSFSCSLGPSSCSLIDTCADDRGHTAHDESTRVWPQKRTGRVGLGRG